MKTIKHPQCPNCAYIGSTGPLDVFVCEKGQEHYFRTGGKITARHKLLEWICRTGPAERGGSTYLRLVNERDRTNMLDAFLAAVRAGHWCKCAADDQLRGGVT